jgi:nitrogen fixation/metabolism regulation signal transduction histidine kinase
MRISQRASRTGSDLVSILVLYILLAATVAVLASTLFRDTALAGEAPFIALLAALSAVPIVVIIVVAVNFRRLYLDRRFRRPGARLKLRLVLFFILLNVLAMAPQAIVAFASIGTVVDSWFTNDIGAALSASRSQTLALYRDRVDALKRFAEEGIGVISERPDARHDSLGAAVARIRPEGDLVQVFDADGNERFSHGPAEFAAGFEEIRGMGQGLLPQKSAKGLSMVRYLVKTRVSTGEAYVLVGIPLPEGFDESAEMIERASATFDRIDRMKPYLQPLLLAFIALFSLPLLSLSILISFSMSDAFVAPMVTLEEAMRKVASGDLSYRLIPRARDELSGLMEAFNRMVSELNRSRAASLQEERISIWQDLARKLAHEIKNPLTPIKLSAERVLRKHRDGDEGIKRILEPCMLSIIQEVAGLATLVGEFRDFARLPEPQLDWTDLAKIARECVATFESSYPKVVFDTSRLAESITILVDRSHMHQVLTNLLSNAIDAMDQEGRVELRSDIVKRSNARYCRLEIRDDGKGIPEESRASIFTPYFTTKETGTGLGLSIVEHIIFDHRGKIWFESEEGVGTSFFIDLPLENPPPQARKESDE